MPGVSWRTVEIFEGETSPALRNFVGILASQIWREESHVKCKGNLKIVSYYRLSGVSQYCCIDTKTVVHWFVISDAIGIIQYVHL